MNRFFKLIALLPTIAFAAESDHRAWKWQQDFAVRSPGLTRLELAPRTLDASQPSFADIRVVSPDGTEIPYLVDIPKQAVQSTQQATGFKATLIDGKTILEADASTNEAITAITLTTPSNQFLKSLQVEASLADGNWVVISASEVIFHDANGVERLEIPIPNNLWKHIRVTIDDKRTLPVPFTGMKLTLAGKQPPTVEQTAIISLRKEDASRTILHVFLGAENLDLADLRLEIADPVFMRRCTLSYPVRGENGEVESKVLANHAIYRVADDSGASSTQVSIPIQQRVPSRVLILTIPNNDNPPLQISSARASRYPTNLVFYAPNPGAWYLLTGHPLISKPNYDISQLQNRLGTATQVTTGPLIEKDDYTKPTTLPEIDPQGATINLKPWKFRKKVTPFPAMEEIRQSGVIQIDLDTDVLAHSQSNLSDLRLVQNGNQIPFVISPAKKSASLTPTFHDEPDPKRPQVSRWKVEMPIDQLPANALHATSSSPLFNRQFQLTTERKDSYGNPYHDVIAYAQWTKTTSNSNDGRLSIDLTGNRLPKSFILETDNGDNPAIPLEQITIQYPVPTILAKITDLAPLYLYYGNSMAHTPAYDLDLVSGSLRSAEKDVATLSKEESLQPESARQRDTTSGSPWLWLALGSVIVVLLVIVAKLLPKQPEPQQ